MIVLVHERFTYVGVEEVREPIEYIVWNLIIYIQKVCFYN